MLAQGPILVNLDVQRLEDRLQLLQDSCMLLFQRFEHMDFRHHPHSLSFNSIELAHATNCILM